MSTRQSSIILNSFLLWLATLLLLLVFSSMSKTSAEVMPRNGLQINLKAGANHWGYGSTDDHCSLFQSWDGSGFTAETKVYFPLKGQPGRFPRESWYGIYIADTLHGHRYTFGPLNMSWEMNPNSFSLGVVTYEGGGNWKPLSDLGGMAISYDKGFVFLRLQFIPSKGGKNSRIIAWAAVPGEDWVELWDYKAPRDLAPNRIGLSVESFHGDEAYGPVTFEYFMIAGSGPARSTYFGEGWSLENWEANLGNRLSLLLKSETEGGLQLIGERTEVTRVKEGTIRIDGAFSDWEDLGIIPIKKFKLQSDLRDAPYRTEVRFAHDFRYLYLWVSSFDEPEGDLLYRKMNGDIDWQQDDTIEVLIVPQEGERRRYVFNAGGTKFDVFVPDAGEANYLLATKIEASKWQAEVAIPLGTGQLPKPKAGSKWQIMLVRHYPNAQATLIWPGLKEKQLGEIVFE